MANLYRYAGRPSPSATSPRLNLRCRFRISRVCVRLSSVWDTDAVFCFQVLQTLTLVSTIDSTQHHRSSLHLRRHLRRLRFTHTTVPARPATLSSLVAEGRWVVEALKDIMGVSSNLSLTLSLTAPAFARPPRTRSPLTVAVLQARWIPHPRLLPLSAGLCLRPRPHSSRSRRLSAICSEHLQPPASQVAAIFQASRLSIGRAAACPYLPSSEPTPLDPSNTLSGLPPQL